jgi:hypothetical protein
VFDIKVLDQGMCMVVNVKKIMHGNFVCGMESFGNFLIVITWVSLYLPPCILILLYVDEVL